MSKKNVLSGIFTTLLATLLIAGCHKTENKPNPADASNAQPATPPPPPDDNAAQSTATTPAPSASSASASAPAQPAGTASSGTSAPTAAPATQASAAQPSAPAPVPIVVPARSNLAIRLNQRISVKTSRPGDRFSGTLVNPVAASDGSVAIPAGSTAEGVVVAAHRRGRFKGRSILQLTLTGLEVNGRHYQIDTRSLTASKKGKGKRTAAFIGGGTGLGMLIGGVATGGVGLLIGGLSGAGAGTLGAAFTGNRDIEYPAESVVNFRLAQPIRLQ